MSEIGLFDAIYSARSLRRLKPDPGIRRDPHANPRCRHPRALGGQRPALGFPRGARRGAGGKLGAIYRKASDIASAVYQARGRPAHMTDEQFRRFLASGAYLWEHMGDAPVLLVPCLRERPPPPRETLPPSVQRRYEEELAYERRIRGAASIRRCRTSSSRAARSDWAP